MALNPKFKLGMGIGCGVLLVAVLMIFGGFVYFAKQMGKDYAQVKDLEEQLVTAGGPADQLPAGFAGLPTAERLEVFLTVREGTAEWRRQVEISFAELLAGQEPGQEPDQGFGHFLKMFKASRDLAPVFAGMWTSRNRALLDGGMGMAEYIYLYCLTSYAWLGRDPADGATDAGDLLAGMGATGTMEVTAGDLEAGRRERQRWAWTQVNRLMTPLIRQAAREAAGAADPEIGAWAGLLQQEAGRLADDPLRLPFADGIPPVLAERLEPFRARLEAAYSATVNPIELIFEDTWAQEVEAGGR